MTISNMDSPCGFEGCTLLVGDHTLRQMTEHAERGIDLPYEDDPLAAVGKMTTTAAGLPEGTIVADSVTARATVMTGLMSDAGGAEILTPMLVLDFGIGVPGAPPRDTGHACVLGTPDMMRRLGKLLRDTCNGAANAAERAAQR